MIWLSLISFLFFFGLEGFGGNALSSYSLMNETGVKYFRWCCYFGPIQPLLIGIPAFYIGQGKTRLIQRLAMIGNVVNLVLDPLFIFTFDMGVSGAAIATGIGMPIQLVIVFCLFLSRQNRSDFGTGNWKLQRPLFWKILRFGTPPAVFVALEFLDWALFYWMMERTSPIHILAASIAQSIGLLFFFFGLALEKGAATVAGDTLYLLLTGTFAAVFFLILPTYYFVMKPAASITIGFSIWVFYSIALVLFNYIRFAIGSWKKKVLIEPELSQ